MTQTLERLELSPDIFLLLEQMARARQLTPSEFVTDLIREFQATEKLAALREEYQHLTQKAMLHTITHKEEERLDALCIQISDSQRRPDREYVMKQRNRKADELIEKSEHLLELAHQQSIR